MTEGAVVDEERVNSRLERIMGHEGIERLAASRVMVIGLGGVGSSCVEALARGGVGTLILADRDVVQPSDINRQAIAFHSTVGRRKVDVMQEMVLDINPAAVVHIHHGFLLEKELRKLFDVYGTDVDFVVDAIDTLKGKLAIAQISQERSLPLVSSMGAANKFHPECLRFADIADTYNCPFSRVIRKETRKRGIEHLRVLFSCEQPVKLPRAEGSTRADRSDLGTASYLPPIMGQMIAGDVLCTLTGVGNGTVDLP